MINIVYISLSAGGQPTEVWHSGLLHHLPAEDTQQDNIDAVINLILAMRRVNTMVVENSSASVTERFRQCVLAAAPYIIFKPVSTMWFVEHVCKEFSDDDETGANVVVTQLGKKEAEESVSVLGWMFEKIGMN